MSYTTFLNSQARSRCCRFHAIIEQSMSQPFKNKTQTNIKKEEGSLNEVERRNDQKIQQNNNEGWQEIPLKCCTEKDLKDIRYHIMKFHTKQNVDIMDSFTKPVRLHRKDPRNIQFHLSRQELDRRRAEEAQNEQEGEQDGRVENKNEVDMSQIAPDGGARKSKRSLFKRKTRQINMMDEQKRKLRYEEYYPWVIEDYDGQNVYVGNYEAGSSDMQSVLFVFDKDGFKMVPTEKVYKFTPRNKYATLTLEEAEAKMEKKSSVPRWLMRHMEEQATNEGSTQDVRFRPNNISNSIAPVNSEVGGRRLRTVTGASSSNDRDSDHDDLDYDEEFADDEEAPIMDGDEEENKLSEQKIKKEMLKASHFDGHSDVEVDDQELDDLFEVEKARKVDKEGKKLRKVLNKTEGGVYDSDDDDNLVPFVSSSDLESDESSDESVNVKVEQDENSVSAAGQSDLARSFSARYLGNCYISIKAPAQFLKGFPIGEWNPNILKRPLVTESETKDFIKKPSLSNGIDLTSSGPENTLVTIQEVVSIVKDHPITTKELLLQLKGRVNSNKENKQRIITIVKQNLKLVDGKLYLKNNI